MAEEHKIVPGDNVQLKCGGPGMTVTGIDETDAICIWMDGNKKMQERFPVLSLVWLDPNRSII